MPQRDFATDGWLAASVDRAHYPRGEASTCNYGQNGTERRLHMRWTTTALALHKEVEVDGPWTAVDIVSNIRHVGHTSVGHAAAAVALLRLAKLYLLTFGGMIFSSGFFCGNEGSVSDGSRNSCIIQTEKRMNMEVTNLTWEIPWIILVDVQLPDELNGKRLLLDFPSKHGVLKWSFELVPDRWARRICRPPRQRPEIR
uniref:Uncharacterized protein n=1 Tax=Oryza punctata TaxID=4537 RepID=A0A0E0K572_ORYPU